MVNTERLWLVLAIREKNTRRFKIILILSTTERSKALSLEKGIRKTEQNEREIEVKKIREKEEGRKKTWWEI